MDIEEAVERASRASAWTIGAIRAHAVISRSDQIDSKRAEEDAQGGVESDQESVAPDDPTHVAQQETYWLLILIVFANRALCWKSRSNVLGRPGPSVRLESQHCEERISVPFVVLVQPFEVIEPIFHCFQIMPESMGSI